jgi:regulator of protease activity HflC (stomatin/prohibitin superfamily)
MFDKLIDLIISFGQDLLPVEVINHYDRGVRLRFGRAVCDDSGKPIILEPGLHWKWPFIDNINSHMVKVTTMDLKEQTVTTKDGQSIVVRGVLKYEVDDVAQLLLEVDSPAAAVADMSMGILRDTFIEKNWDECNDPDLPKQITTKIKRESKKWGIDVKAVTLTDLAIMRSIRLLQCDFFYFYFWG